MKKETLFIAIGNQKGGVGKSTITTTIASYLQYIENKNIAIIDCDFPQYSIYKMRELDIETIYKSNELQAMLKKQFGEPQKKSYPIIVSQPEKAIQCATELIKSNNEEFDIIFFDLPGNVMDEGLLTMIFNLNYIFIPIIADNRVLQSSLSFTLAIKECLENRKINNRLRDVKLFWNKVDKRENTELYDFFNKTAKSENISILKTVLPDTKKFNKELSTKRSSTFRSTLFAPNSRMLRGSNLKELVKEMCNIIGI